jgi:glycosyltransferase involved in cell wall biosynthesis
MTDGLTKSLPNPHIRPVSVGRVSALVRSEPAIANLEGEAGFDVHWPWAEGPLSPGMTAIVRAKDESRTLPWSLPGLLRAVDRVVLIDNGSTDSTGEVARRIAAEHGHELDVLEYPFAVARCGAEHLATPARSVHSLTHFYNWSFSHARTRYVLKWDADMVLGDFAVSALRDLAWQLETAERVIRVPRRPLYVLDERRAFIDLGLWNNEPWAWPNRPGFSFVKAFDWELPVWGGRPRQLTLPDFGCVELKLLDADEFGHWSPTDFAASARTERKRRELEVFAALAAGGPVPGDVVEIVAPPGRRVVEYVRSEWLPAIGRSRRYG